MKRLLLPLLAALDLPTAVNAETWWLLVRGKRLGAEPVVVWEIPITSEKECEIAKTKVLNSENWEGYKSENIKPTAICLKGK